MRNCWLLIYLISAVSVSAQKNGVTASLPDSRIMQTVLDPNTITVLRLKPGYVTSIRVPEDVSSVVLGNPASFKAEHSESEPRLVFLKPAISAPGETNALITTKAGKEISLHLVSSGIEDRDGPIDFVLEYAKPHSFLVDDSRPDFVVADSRIIGNALPPMPDPKPDLDDSLGQMFKEESRTSAHWQGKQLRVALGRVTDGKRDMIVVFSVLNSSSKTIELLPPQLQLAGVSKSKHKKAILAAQVPVKDYRMSQKRLPPRSQAKVAVSFERPSFKEASEEIFLQVAQAEQVDHPVLIRVPFVPSSEGDTK